MHLKKLRADRISDKMTESHTTRRLTIMVVKAERSRTNALKSCWLFAPLRVCHSLYAHRRNLLHVFHTYSTRLSACTSVEARLRLLASVAHINLIHAYTPDGGTDRGSLLSRNGEESWKMIQDPRKNSDRHQNLIDSSFGHAPPLQKISFKNPFGNFRNIPPTHRQSDRRTDKQTDTQKQRLHYLLGACNNVQFSYFDRKKII